MSVVVYYVGEWGYVCRRMCWEQSTSVKERCVNIYKKENRKVKKRIYQSKKDLNDQFQRKMNQDVKGKRKLI